MQTLNISLPSSLAIKVDEAVEKHGYASRSEFFRSLLRLFLVKENELKFEAFDNVSLESVKKGLLNSKKHNKKFIDSVMKGFAKSSVYAQN